MNGVVKQLSVFVNNEPGALVMMTRIMKDCGANIRAFSISESIGFGVFRAIVDDPEGMAKMLKAKGLVVKLTDVIAIEMDSEPGSLYKEAELISRSGLNIEYAYAYSGNPKPVLYVKMDNLPKAIELLKKEGIKFE